MEKMNFEMQNIENSDERRIDLVELLLYLWKKIGYIILTVLIAAVLALGITYFFITPTYESTTKMYILPQADETVITYNDLQTGTSLTQDYMSLVTCRPVLEKVILSLKLDLTASELESHISVSNPTNTRILVLSVIYPDRSMAQKIANAVRDEAGDKIKQVMQINDVKVVEYANYPDGKYAPSNSRNTIIGMLVGLFLSAGVIFIMFTFNDKIKTADDAQKYLNLAVIGTIPNNEYLKGKKKPKKKKAKVTSNKFEQMEKATLNKIEKAPGKKVDSISAENELKNLLSGMNNSQKDQKSEVKTVDLKHEANNQKNIKSKTFENKQAAYKNSNKKSQSASAKKNPETIKK